MMNKQILDGAGVPVTSERVKLDKQSRFNPLASLTPLALSQQLVAYQQGEFRRIAWTMEWMEQHDDMVSSVAEKAKAAVSRHGYDILEKEEIPEGYEKMAEDQKAVLSAFYQNIETTSAVERHECGGMRLLIKQVMDGYGKGYAVHHIVWEPTDHGLQAKLIFVPLWFFESMDGDLRFVEEAWGYRGKPLDEYGGDGAWMVSKGRGVMLACSIARMFKQLPMQDWVTYSSRHGMPAFLGKTSASYGDDQWNTMVNTVSTLGAEWSGVVNQQDAIEVLDLTSKGELPYEKLIERMDRAITILWRGGDLSTMSNDGGSVGSNAQTSEADMLDEDNAAWVGETIDRQLSRRVLDYHFGEDAPTLAYLRIRTASKDDAVKEMAVIKGAVEMGMRVSAAHFSEKFSVPEADEDEINILRLGGSPAPAGEEVPAENTDEDPTVANEQDEDAAMLVKNSMSEILGVGATVLSPLDDYMTKIMSETGELDHDAFLDFVEAGADQLPELFDGDLSQANLLADELEEALGTASLLGARDFLRTQKKESTN